MGFQEVEKFRSPNSRVMRLMMAELGLPYDVKEHNWREDYRKYLGAKIA
jgi:glutathione S-transferase